MSFKPDDDQRPIMAEAINLASASLDPAFKNFPQEVSGPPSWDLGESVICKLEFHNPTGSFKGRGTTHLIKSLSDKSPLVSATAGNFGIALAYAAVPAAVTVHIFVAEDCDEQKLQRMQETQLLPSWRLVQSLLLAASSRCSLTSEGPSPSAGKGREPAR